MIDMVQKYMRGDATRMETYIELGLMVNEYKLCLDAIRSIHANFYDLPDDTRYSASSYS